MISGLMNGASMEHARECPKIRILAPQSAYTWTIKMIAAPIATFASHLP